MEDQDDLVALLPNTDPSSSKKTVIAVATKIIEMMKN
jgi:hypothetical protein